MWLFMCLVYSMMRFWLLHELWNEVSMCLGLDKLRYNNWRRRWNTLSAKMAAASFGEFDDSKEVWLSHTDQMQQYFVANAASEDRQRATLLSTCGPANYQLIKDVVAPEKPTARTFEELVWLVNAHKNPQPSMILQHFHFHSRLQMETETIP